MASDNDELRRIGLVMLVSGAAGLLVGIARGIILEKYGTWGHFFRAVLASIVVAVLTALALDDSGLSTTKQGAVIGILSMVADDMLAGLMIAGRLAASDPVGFVRGVLRSLLGGGPPNNPPGGGGKP